jgi:hypothetical protein
LYRQLVFRTVREPRPLARTKDSFAIWCVISTLHHLSMQR